MVAKAVSTRLEAMVDRFELDWTEFSRDQIPALLAEVGLESDSDAFLELLRIDIQRRYAAKVPVELDSYLVLVSSQVGRLGLQRVIAYEDFRTRRACNEACLPERWAGITGIEAESWYRALKESHGYRASRTCEVETRPFVFDGHESPISSAEAAIRSAGFSPVRQIGQGAFSRVFLARQESLASRYVVVKAVQRTFAEADRLAELQHTNIVPIYSLHRCGHWSLMCMPYAGLVTLADYFVAVPDSNSRSGQTFVSTIRLARDATVRPLMGHDVPETQSRVSDAGLGQQFEAASETILPLHRDALALWLFARIADALHHAHTRGIVHGDIKPANLLIRNDGEPALLDFNLSQKRDEPESTVAGGTLPYMSPESLRSLMGASIPLTVESDIYSLGAVFYQFLTGRLAHRPPHSAAPVDLEVAIAQRQRGITWDAVDNVSPAIRAIVEKCLAPTSNHRYASAEYLREDLECERLCLPLKHAHECSLRHRGRKWIARHPRFTSAASVSGIAVAIIMLMLFTLWRVTASRQSLVAEKTFQRFEAEAKNSLAELSSVGRTGQVQALQRAHACLTTYEVLDNPRWQENGIWKGIPIADRQKAISLMTNLMLRISWNEVSNTSFSEQAKSESRSAESEIASLSVQQLTKSPFADQAPLAIALVSQTFDRPVGLQSSVSKLGTDALQANGLSSLDQLGLATRYIEMGNGDDALKLLGPHLLQELDEYTYWITRGRAQTLTTDLRGAELSFSMALERYPASSAAYHYRGVCRMKMRHDGEMRKAVDDFSSALKCQPDANESLLNRAMAKEVLGDLTGAISDLMELLDQRPNDTQTLIVLSRLYRKQNNHVLAERTLETVLRSHPSSVSGWVSLALTRLTSDKEGAVRDLLQAQRLAPQSIEVLQNLAHVYSEHLNDSTKAIETLDRLLTLSPEYEHALLGRGVLHAREGNIDAALDDLRTAARASGSLMPSSLYQAACIYAQILTYSDDVKAKTRWQQNAMACLTTSVQQGYGANLFETDKDLSSIRNDPRFQSLLTTVRASRTLRQVQW
jgi:eukaryotic-like serine/threonine-protein kinase